MKKSFFPFPRGVCGPVFGILFSPLFLILNSPAWAQFDNEEAMILSVEGCYQVEKRKEELQLNRSEGSAWSPRGQLRETEINWVSVKQLGPGRYGWYHLTLEGSRLIFTHAEEWNWQPALFTSMEEEGVWEIQSLSAQASKGLWSMVERTPYGTISQSCLGKMSTGKQGHFSCALSPSIQEESPVRINDSVFVRFYPDSNKWSKVRKHPDGVTSFITFKRIDDAQCKIERTELGERTEVLASYVWAEREHQIETLYEAWNRIFSKPGSRVQLRSPLSRFGMAVNQVLEKARKKETSHEDYTLSDLQAEVREFIQQWTTLD